MLARWNHWESHNPVHCSDRTPPPIIIFFFSPFTTHSPRLRYNGDMTLILHTSSDPSRTPNQEAFHRLTLVGEFAAHIIEQPRRLDSDEASSLTWACSMVAQRGNVFRRALKAAARTQFGSRYRSEWAGLDLLVGAAQSGAEARIKRRHLRVENGSSTRLCLWAQGRVSQA